MKILYEDFLSNVKVYHICKGFWARLIKNVDKNLEGKPYLNDRFVNGKLFYDGNPIYNIYFESNKKMIRIIQLSKDELDNADYYTSWVENIQFSDFVADEKTISLVLTSKNADKAKEEIRRWLKK